MKITFGKVPQEQMDMGDETFTGQDKHGNTAEFYFMLKLDEEGSGNGTFTIHDTCDRYMPFDLEQLDELHELITKLKSYRDDRIKFENYWKAAWGVPE